MKHLPFHKITLPVMAVLVLGLVAIVSIADDKTAGPALGIPATDDGLPGAGPIRRYDWFRSLWLKRRSAWAARVDKDQHALVFLGDSITQGWGDDFGGSFPGV